MPMRKITRGKKMYRAAPKPNYSKPSRAAAAGTIQRFWRSRPSRFPSGKKTYTQTRSIAKVIQNMSETKIQALRVWSATPPLPVEVLPTSGPCYFTNYCLGTAPTGWNGPNGAAAFNNLNGFEWAPGTGANERVGQYMYLKKTTINLRVAMNASSRTGTTKFRVIVYKEKRNRYNTTANGNPCDDLFINQAGKSVGVNTAASVNARALDFNTWLVNKRNYQLVKDFKFVLAPETLSYQGGSDPRNVNQVSHAEKIMQFSLGHYQKAKFSTADNTPEDQMYRYCVSIISMPMSDSIAAHNSYKTYVNGVVSCVDN